MGLQKITISTQFAVEKYICAITRKTPYLPSFTISTIHCQSYLVDRHCLDKFRNVIFVLFIFWIDLHILYSLYKLSLLWLVWFGYITNSYTKQNFFHIITYKVWHTNRVITANYVGNLETMWNFRMINHILYKIIIVTIIHDIHT